LARKKSKSLIKPKFDYEKLIQTGKVAKIKRYQDYITRIANGEQLKPAELKDLRILESEIEQEANGDIKEKKIIENNKEAAEYCGLSTRMISYHLKRGNIRQNTDGTFEKKDLDKWLIRSGRKKTTSEKTTSEKDSDGKLVKTIDEQIEIANLRFRVARAKREEMITEQQAGNLISKQEVHEQWAQRVASVKQGLLNFIERLSPILEKKTRKQIALILEKEVDELLSSYSKIGEYNPRLKN
jgi:hypothetical protein